MRIFTRKIFTHRKIVLVFLLAILLPSLIVSYLSISTFSKRRETVKKLLESNLWISGEAGLKSVEEALLEYEKKTLNSENLISLIQTKKEDTTFINSSLFSNNIAGQLFLLGPDYKIIFPLTGNESTFKTEVEKELSDNRFAQFFQRAEFFEFSQKNYTRAAELYRECTLFAPSKQYRAIAFEGLGRCFISSEKYDEANEVYNELSKNYGQFQNKAGHPYGIVAAFQLYEIAKEKKQEEKYLGILLDLYEKVREGIWIISQPVFDFYIGEIESILNSQLKEGKFPELQKSYANLQRKQSPYSQALTFTDLLMQRFIPELKGRSSLSREADEVVPGRLLITLEKDIFLFSYVILPDFHSERTFYGICWDISFFKNQIIQKVFEEITKESGLVFKIIDEGDRNIFTGKEELSSAESLALNFRIFPLPWKLLLSHPEIKALEKAAQREIFFYGVLLTVIVVLMLLGAVLIVRDISRESETTRLKTEFVNNISHELKTPLTLIRLYGETLQRKENLTNEEKKDCYEIITKESERLSHLINNVLDFSRIEMGRKEFDFKKGNLADVIEDTLESYRYHLEKKGFAIRKDIARDLPEMSFDGEAMASVMVNLLSNAMKFSPNEKEVIVKLSGENGNAVLRVTDKGVGISQKEIPKIFERFYQSENKISSEAKGSGLGLTLVKHIVEAHGGTIEVDSEVGKGSRFTVSIPMNEI